MSIEFFRAKRSSTRAHRRRGNAEVQTAPKATAKNDIDAIASHIYEHHDWKKVKKRRSGWAPGGTRKRPSVIVGSGDVGGGEGEGEQRSTVGSPCPIGHHTMISPRIHNHKSSQENRRKLDEYAAVYGFSNVRHRRAKAMSKSKSRAPKGHEAGPREGAERPSKGRRSVRTEYMSSPHGRENCS